MASLQLRYKDKVTVITGGSQGIGEGCVRVFVRNGSKVVFCAPEVDGGKSLECEMNEQGPGEAYYVQCDVTKEQQVKNLIDKAVEKYGKIDCLINNAGSHPSQHTIDEFSAQDFRDLFELNVMGYFLASKYALPHLRKTEGNIINTSSLSNNIGQSRSVTYCATKGAIAAMTRALAIDEAEHNVRVNAVCPGNVWTPLWDKLATECGQRELAIKGGEDAQLLGRMGTIEELGEAYLFLAESGYVTGIDLPVSGGAELNFGPKSRHLKDNMYDL